MSESNPPDQYKPHQSAVAYTADLRGSIRLSAQGLWTRDNEPFTNEKVISLFNRSIVWDPSAKDWFVHIGRERARFDCEDTPWFVTELTLEGVESQVTLSDLQKLTFIAESLRTGKEGQFYYLLGEYCGKPSAFARLSRGPHQVLLSFATDDETIALEGKHHRIPLLHV